MEQQNSPIRSVQLNIVIGLLLLLLVAAIAIASKAYETPSAPNPLRWEYKVEKIQDSTFAESMNKLGAEGWEAVSARRATDSVTTTVPFYYEIIFRRPLLLQSGP